jgi:hypothetical protein
MLKKKQLGFIISHLSEGIMMFMVDLVTREPLILKTIQLDQLLKFIKPKLYALQKFNVEFDCVCKAGYKPILGL